ncbi:hypothetical protein K501DRAFT_319850 [Backusella circina FSU 941]|nr:hypothetical protein K501DRAFT_319850 [Backusella circina FSU 941]
MDRNSRFQPYDRAPQRQGQGNGQNFRRDDFNGGRRGGGPMRERGGRRGHHLDRHAVNRHQPKRPPRGISRKGPNEWPDEHHGHDDSRLPPHIESRVARERPCRTLFVRNIQYKIPEEQVRGMFEKFGEIKDVFNLIDNRGMIFITFYDVRAAEDAKESMQGIFLSDRKIDVHYSLPKEEEEKSKCDRNKNQGTLLYTLKNSNAYLDDFELSEYFTRYGEVKAIRVPHFKKNSPGAFSQQRLVEFYDSRSCNEAYDATINANYKDGVWDVAFFWDHPYKTPGPPGPKKDRPPHDKRDRRLDDRRHSDHRPPRQDDNGYNNNSSSSYNAYSSGGSSYTPGIDNRAYNVPQPSMQPPVQDQRLEQAQKAQQILSMLAHTQQQPPPTGPLSYPSTQPANASPVSMQQQAHLPYHSQVPTQPAVTSPVPVQQSTTHLLQQPFVQPVPPTEDQASQVQQLLGLLTQAAQQQHQPPPPQQLAPQMPVQSMPQQSNMTSLIPQGVAPIPGMDPATALSQLAQILQQQQQQQQQSPQQQSQQPQ